MAIKKKVREEVYLKYNKHCAYCGKELKSIKDMQVDHIIPKSTGVRIKKDGELMYQGKDCKGDIYYIKDLDCFENINPACRRCNHYKRAELLDVFREQIMTIKDRLMKIYIFKVAFDYGIVKIKHFDGLFYFEKLKEEE